MAEEILRDDTTDLPGFTPQGVSEIRASLTAKGKVPEDLILGFNSGDPQIKKASLIQIRTIIQNPSPPEAVQAVLDTELVPAIVSLLDSEDSCLQFEATWIVTNLASGTPQQTEQVIDAGAIPKLIILSASPNADVAQEAVWALGNVLGHSASLRDRVDEEGGVAVLVKLVDRGESSFEKVQRRAVWAIFNYLDVWPSGELPITRIKHVLPCLARYIQETPANEANMEFIEYAVQALGRICDHGLQRTDFIATGVVPRLVKLLADSSSSVALQQGVLRCLGYLVSGSNDETDLAINAGQLDNLGDFPPSEAAQPVIGTGLVPAIVSLLDSEDTSLQYQAAWIVTDLTFRTTQQTEQVIDAGAIPRLIILSASPNADVAETAVWSLGNMAGDSGRLRDRVEEEGGVAALVKVVDRGEPGFEKVQRTAVRAIFFYLDPRHSPKLPITRIKHVLACLTRYIQETPVNEANMEFIAYAADGLYRIGDHGLQRTDFIATGVVPCLVKLLAESSSSVALQKGVLRCLGYLVSGSNDDRDLAINAGLLNDLGDLSPSEATQPVIANGLVPAIVSLLDSEDPSVQRDVLFIVKHITAGTTQQTEQIIDAGAIPRLIILSASPDADVADDAAWALGNVLGDSPKLRDRVEEEGGVTALVQLVDRGEPGFEKVQRSAVQAIFSYLEPWSSGKLPTKRTKQVLPCLARYIQETPVNEANLGSIEYAAQALSRICKHPLQRTDFIATGVVPRLAKLLADSSSSLALQSQVLVCLDYVVGGREDERAAAVDAGLLPGLLVALETKDRDIGPWALRSAWKVAAGNHSQVYALLDSGLLKPVVQVLMDDQEPTLCRRNACWTISNLAKKVSGDAKVAQALIEGLCVQALSAALLIPDPKTKERAVIGITYLLEWKPPQESEADDSPLTILRNASGPQHLRAVRDSRDFDDEKIKRECQSLLTRYFPDYSRAARV